MWLPLQLVLEFLGRSLVWLAVMAGLRRGGGPGGHRGARGGP